MAEQRKRKINQFFPCPLVYAPTGGSWFIWAAAVSRDVCPRAWARRPLCSVWRGCSEEPLPGSHSGPFCLRPVLTEGCWGPGSLLVPGRASASQTPQASFWSEETEKRQGNVASMSDKNK